MINVQEIIVLLQSGDSDERYNACLQLMRLSTIPLEAFEALQAATKDADPTVASAAQKALQFHLAVNQPTKENEETTLNNSTNKNGMDTEETAHLSTTSGSSSPKSILLQLTLFLVMLTTIILSVLIRVTGAGWLLVLFFIPLVIVLTIHFVIHVIAIIRIPMMKKQYIFFLLLSNLFFFLGYTLQVDTGDTSGGLAIAVFLKEYFNFIPRFLRIHSSDEGTFMLISLGSLFAVIASWFFLIPGKYFLKESKSRD